MTADSQTPARPAFPREFPFADGAGAVSVALARHVDAPVAGSHVDLFLGPADAAAHGRDSRVARTYRLPLSAWSGDRPAAGIHDAVELDPHRAEYLVLESPRQLPHGRGRVEPLARWRGHATVDGSSIEIRCSGWRARCERVGAADWRIEFAEAPADGTRGAAERT